MALAQNLAFSEENDYVCSAGSRTQQERWTHDGFAVSSTHLEESVGVADKVLEVGPRREEPRPGASGDVGVRHQVPAVDGPRGVEVVQRPKKAGGGRVDHVHGRVLGAVEDAPGQRVGLTQQQVDSGKVSVGLHERHVASKHDGYLAWRVDFSLKESRGFGFSAS